MADSKDYRFVRGVSKSERLGDILSIDFSPKKVCSFDCVFCGHGRTTDKTLQRRAFHPVEEVFGEIQDWVSRNSQPDYVLLTGSGEPTLYSEFGRLVRLIKSGIPGMKSFIFSNASLFQSKEVRQDVADIDLILADLNSDDEDIFRRICRPHQDVRLDRIIDGIKQLKKEYTGQLWINTVLVKGVNTQEKTLESLMDTIKDIGPERCVIRLPAAATDDESERVPFEIPERLTSEWSNLPFEVAYVVYNVS